MKIEIKDEELKTVFERSCSISDICRYLNLPINGTYTRFIKNRCKELSLNLQDLKKRYKIQRSTYSIKTKECPVCNKRFETKIGSKEERTTCSHACANTYFRSGQNHPNFKDGCKSNYRKLAFDIHPHICNRCGYDKYKSVLVVHHKDRNRENNNISNLEILCPNCHNEEHFLANDGLWSN